ncbi:hypothetical protein TBLA_0C05450 [Henningerozyma blattae CBS 6284]|uniref:Peptidase M16 N-terminal domain-containing protein n=1 Tax=Henningerozyma blattae (strain ATCC 34711 / CBS 6284 / DSM 70876 / NBRC 10599 / NRRL Y-10934 / UCD 77-7) TaxID=1071380 RepID=I2H1U1_HENB6|nr:hypothetical protein TBLA_0C05450 [Tetrapisispora blattae CBS 6284]CCH60343.1 hypothetical protein TBLA_0C05450 [Tetrapisispora blattae CBS 6284]
MSWINTKTFDIDFYLPSSYSNRNQKLCRLPNGILALLISDNSVTTTACSISVATGSHSDPRDIPGIAHLCEHMILAAGSKKYPKPGLFHEVLAANNGSQNAFTTGEQTTFYFELPTSTAIEQNTFGEILDIFSSFFKKPLFNEVLTNKEIYAIESEHDGNMSNTSKILYHAERLLSNKSHPFHNFSTGNIHTLSKVVNLKKYNLKEMLFEYFKNNYFSRNMTICIKGPQSLNSLTKLALANFGDIKDKDELTKFHINSIKPQKSLRISKSRSSISSCNSFKTNENLDLENFKLLDNAWLDKYGDNVCFPTSLSHNTIFLSSSKQPILRLLFPISEKLTRFTKRDIKIYSNIWCHIFGDETKGSFCDYLNKNNWITECYAFKSTFAIGNTSLILELKLTNTGVKKLQNIIDILLQQVVKLLVDNFTENLAYFLAENNIISILRFINSDVEINPMDECSELSGLLQENFKLFNPKYLFYGSEFLLLENESLPQKNNMFDGNSTTFWIGQAIKFQTFLKEFMNWENIKIVGIGDIDEFKNVLNIVKEMSKKTDLYYEFEYQKLKISKKSRICPRDYPFTYPIKNEYLPKFGYNLGLLRNILLNNLESSRTVSFYMPQVSEEEDQNKLVSQNDMHKLWVNPKNSKDQLSESPCIVSFKLVNNSIQESPESTMHLELMGQLLHTLLINKLYPALNVGYTFEISPSVRGDVSLSFTLSGFSEGIFKIIKECINIFGELTSSDLITKKEFRRARILVRDKYEDAASDSCVKLASVGLLILLERKMWTLEERIDALELIDLEMFLEFAQKFFQNLFLSLYIEGNLEYADLINSYFSDKLVHHLTKRLDYPKEDTLQSLPSTKLISGTNIYYELEGSVDDPNNSIVYFIQTGDLSNKKILSLTSLTAFIISFSLVPELRNKKQIGYVVFGGLRTLSDTVGLHITIMSDGKPLDIEIEIEKYISYLEFDLLGNLDDETFQNNYLIKYIDLINGIYKKSTEQTSGPINIMNEIIANVHGGDSAILNSEKIKNHKKNKNELFGDAQMTEELKYVDIEFLKNLNLIKYLQFFKGSISTNSKRRSKLSIHIKSPMEERELFNRKLFLQLQTFLKIKGFPIKSNELQQIVERTNGRPTLLFKELFACFKARDESWKFISIVLKEILKVISMSIKQQCKTRGSETRSSIQHSEFHNDHIITPTPLEKVEDINKYLHLR